MVHVFLSKRWRSPRVWRGVFWCLSSSLLVLAPSPTLGQSPPAKAKSSGAAPKDSAKSKATPPAESPAPAPDAAAAPAVDPSQTRKVAPNEIFKDPKAEEILDVEKFPTITFKSTRITRAAGGELAVAGDLTIHGVSRNVVLNVEGPTTPVNDPWGNTRRGLSATTKISRKDFGLIWNATLETGGFLVGDDVNITLDLELVKQ